MMRCQSSFPVSAAHASRSTGDSSFLTVSGRIETPADSDGGQGRQRRNPQETYFAPEPEEKQTAGNAFTESLAAEEHSALRGIGRRLL